MISIPWHRIDSCIRLIAAELSPRYDKIITFNRGGLVPSVMLAHALDIKRVHDTRTVFDELDISSINTDRTLIVDDIYDTGKTISAFIEEVLRCDQRVTGFKPAVATVIRRHKDFNHDQVVPTFYFVYGEVISSDKHVRFPWEISPLEVIK